MGYSDVECVDKKKFTLGYTFLIIGGAIMHHDVVGSKIFKYTTHNPSKNPKKA
jgi:hypothetical protein